MWLCISQDQFRNDIIVHNVLWKTIRRRISFSPNAESGVLLFLGCWLSCLVHFAKNFFRQHISHNRFVADFVQISRFQEVVATAEDGLANVGRNRSVRQIALPSRSLLGKVHNVETILGYHCLGKSFARLQGLHRLAKRRSNLLLHLLGGKKSQIATRWRGCGIIRIIACHDSKILAAKYLLQQTHHPVLRLLHRLGIKSFGVANDLRLIALGGDQNMADVPSVGEIEILFVLVEEVADFRIGNTDL